MTEYIDDKLFPAACFGFYKELLWFVPYSENIICAYNLKSEEIEKAVEIPKVSSISAGFFSTTTLGDNVIIAPAFENKFYLYNINDCSINTFDAVRKDGEESFFLFERFDDRIYFFPINYPSVISICINQTGKVVFNRIEGSLQRIVSKTKIGNKIFLVMKDNSIGCFDINTNKFDILYNSKNEDCYRNIVSIESNLLLTITSDGKGYLLEYDGKITAKQEIFDIGMSIYSCVVIERKLYLFPDSVEDVIIFFDLESWSEHRITIRRNDFYKNWIGASFTEPMVINNNIYVFSPPHQCLMIIDTKNNMIERKYIHKNEIVMKAEGELIKVAFLNGVMTEGNPSCIRLSHFLGQITE